MVYYSYNVAEICTQCTVSISTTHPPSGARSQHDGMLLQGIEPVPQCPSAPVIADLVNGSERRTTYVVYGKENKLLGLVRL